MESVSTERKYSGKRQADISVEFQAKPIAARKMGLTIPHYYFYTCKAMKVLLLVHSVMVLET